MGDYALPQQMSNLYVLYTCVHAVHMWGSQSDI
jgi:hypothetical protein